MEDKFRKWLIQKDGKKHTTAYSYSKAIHRLSDHYSDRTGRYVNIYAINDLSLLAKIQDCYDTLGKYSTQGDYGHGTDRAAIKAFYRYKSAQKIIPRLQKKSSKVMTISDFGKKEVSSERKSFQHFLLAIYKRLFKSQRASEPRLSGLFHGTKEQLLVKTIPLLKNWEEEFISTYQKANLRCQRCNSLEYPSVSTQYAINPERILENVLSNFSDRGKLETSISDIAEKYKKELGDLEGRLLVLCRTCRTKNEERKIERYTHELPQYMRQGPRELRLPPQGPV